MTESREVSVTINADGELTQLKVGLGREKKCDVNNNFLTGFYTEFV